MEKKKSIEGDLTAVKGEKARQIDRATLDLGKIKVKLPDDLRISSPPNSTDLVHIGKIRKVPKA